MSMSASVRVWLGDCIKEQPQRVQIFLSCLEKSGLQQREYAVE